jgi:hypothetical protein
MNRIIFVFVIAIFLSCDEKSVTESDQIKEYYNGFKNGDFDQIRKTISDTITLVEGSYVMPYTKESFREHFKWDSIFEPTYKVVKMEPLENLYVAEISVESLRFDFLKNNPLTSMQRFYFESGKISHVENVGFVGTNWEQWNIQKERLVHWIAINHPELDGFINDLTMQGGLNYLEAIKLYQNRPVEEID